MPTNHTGPLSAEPVFSVIIPLEVHRGQWEQCRQAWAAQTIGKSAFEMILVVPPVFREPILLGELTAGCVELSPGSDGIDLCAAGATRARGKYLLFTEPHCWPEPDVLELCLEAINANSDWAGFTCLSIPKTHNRLSEAEASMYKADIEYAAQIRARPKNLYQCFVTTREAYEDCGGFKSGLGFFAEWVLSASYFQRGYKIGYFPKARFHHYYSGSLSNLRDFTLNFTAGEMHYFGGHLNSSGGFLDIPPEWICQGNFNRDAAKTVLHIAAQGLRSPRSYRDLPRTIAGIGRWLPPAIFGDRLVRIGAAAAVAYARIALLLVIAIGSQQSLNDRFRKYIARLIHAQRLATIAVQREARRDVTPPSHVGFSLDAITLNTTGFYPLEQSQGNHFRWSETEAAVLVSVPAGRQKIHIECIPVRDLSDARSNLRFYVDGVRVPSNQLWIEANRISIELYMTRHRTVALGWSCLPLIAPDSRQLGLAIKDIGSESSPVG